MIVISECQQKFKVGSKLYNICVGADSLPLEKINSYRNRWGLGPLAETDRPPTVVVPKRTPSLKPEPRTVASPVKKRVKRCSGCAKKKPVVKQQPTKQQPKLTPPSFTRQAWNLARSLADFAADGLRTVTKEQYEERLGICDSCEYRRNNRCMKCGCRLSLKAKGKAFKCPIGSWPKVDA